MNRRFVNLVMQRCADCVYSVRRIDPYNNFFYRSAKAALEAADEAAKKKESFPAMQTLQLPRPTMNFTPAASRGTLDMFALFSARTASEGRMVYTNMFGEAGLYDADKNVLSTMGSLITPKIINPICLSIAHPGTDEDSLYVLNRFPETEDDRCFEVLESVPRRSESSYFMATWRWRLLPPPPFVCQPMCERSSINSSITSYTTKVDGNGCSTIYVSCGGGIGTYSFETVRLDSSHRLGWRHSEEWSQVGEWQLPFADRAQYVPEFNLWLGFLEFSPNHLCAMDLSAMDHERPPTVQQVWQDLNPPEGGVWFPINLNLLNLGDGKFLIAKTFEAEATSELFVVFLGIEMMAGVGDDQSLQMVKHKCARFDITNDYIEWVL